VRTFSVLAAFALGGCVLLPAPKLPDSEAQLRVRRALRDLEMVGFRLPGSFDLVWSDPSVRCVRGHVCISPELRPEGGGTLILAPRVLESDARLRLALLEVWQRLSDRGPMSDTRAFARSALRQLVSGPRLGVSDPVILGQVLEAYRGYRDSLPEEQRAGLPDPGAYSRELGLFLVPVSLPEPDAAEGERPSLAPQGLGLLSLGPCSAASRYVHVDLPGGEGRREYWSGICAEEAGRLEEAVVHLIRAEYWLPHDPRVPLELGEVLCVMGHWRPGILAFERAADRSPAAAKRADALRGIGRCYLAAGQFGPARRAYREVLALDPDDVITADWLRWIEGRVVPTPPVP
jgi:tetratricopeptide (TPR) repeat protein